MVWCSNFQVIEGKILARQNIDMKILATQAAYANAMSRSASNITNGYFSVSVSYKYTIISRCDYGIENVNVF